MNRPFFHLILLFICGLAAIFGGMVFLSTPDGGVLCGSVFTALLYLAYWYACSDRLGAESEAVIILSLGCCLLMATGGLFDCMDWPLFGPYGDALSGYAVGCVAASALLAYLINKQINRIPVAMALTAVIAIYAVASLYSRMNTVIHSSADNIPWLTFMAFFCVAVLTRPFLFPKRPLAKLIRLCVLEFALFSPYLLMKEEGIFISAFLLVLLNGTVMFIAIKKDWLDPVAAIALLVLTLSLKSLYANIANPGWEVSVIFILYIVIIVFIAFWIVQNFREIKLSSFLLLTITLFMIPLDYLPKQMHVIIPFSNVVFLSIVALPVIYAVNVKRWQGTMFTDTAARGMIFYFRIYFRPAVVIITAFIIFLPSYSNIIKATINHDGPTGIIAGLTSNKGLISESLFIKLAMKDAYLWQDKTRVTGVSDTDPDELLYKLRYEAQDKGFSYTSTTAEAEGANNGIQYNDLGFSIKTIDKRLFIQYVDKNSPAGRAGLMRGFEIVEFNHNNLEEIRFFKLMKGIIKDMADGKEIHLRLKDLEGYDRDVNIKNGTFEQDPPLDVIFEQNGRKIGYLLFWSFDSQQELGLENIFARFEKEGIDDLILDLRYNSGGRLNIAQNLASMMSVDATKGKLFVKCIYNNRYRDRNKEYYFIQTPHGLNLKRLVVLTGKNTASASELIINGLRPYIPVITIGATTTGKSVGQNPIEYGKKTLYLVTFRCYNARNESDYLHQGIPPDFPVEDDLTHPLGSPEEAMTKVALEYLGSGLSSILARAETN